MIISSGYNSAGPEVEATLLAHKNVTECAVVATPDEARGHVVTAFVVLADDPSDHETMKTELQEFVKARIAPYKYPRLVHFVPELPKTTTGKIQRFKLRASASTS